MNERTYWKKKFTGEELTLEERIFAFFEGSLLSGFGCFYIPLKAVSNMKEFFMGKQIEEFALDPSLAEYFGGIGEYFNAARRGKFEQDNPEESIKELQRIERYRRETRYNEYEY